VSEAKLAVVVGVPTISVSFHENEGMSARDFHDGIRNSYGFGGLSLSPQKYKWVTETLNLDQEDAELLKKQKITGVICSSFFFF
jgi:hypothetical protein